MSALAEAPVRLTPHERLEALCDPGTIRTIRSGAVSAKLGPRAIAGDGVVGGTGTVDGRPIACYAQDGSFLGGSLGERHADTIVRVLQTAARARIPVVGFVESGGARMQEGTAALAGYGRIFRQTVALTGVVPQISVVSGTSAGGGAYSPALTDLIVMTEDAAMFLTGPSVVREALGEEIDVADLGGPRVHDRNGVCHLVEADERAAAARVRDLLSYLPSSSGRTPPRSLPLAPLAVDGARRTRRASSPRLLAAPTTSATRCRRSSIATRSWSCIPAGPATSSPRWRGSTAGRSRSSPTSRAIWAACSTPRARRRRPGSCRCATRSGCRWSPSSTPPGSCRAPSRSRPA